MVLSYVNSDTGLLNIGFLKTDLKFILRCVFEIFLVVLRTVFACPDFTSFFFDVLGRFYRMFLLRVKNMGENDLRH